MQPIPDLTTDLNTALTTTKTEEKGVARLAQYSNQQTAEAQPPLHQLRSSSFFSFSSFSARSPRRRDTFPPLRYCEKLLIFPPPVPEMTIYFCPKLTFHSKLFFPMTSVCSLYANYVLAHHITQLEILLLVSLIVQEGISSNYEEYQSVVPSTDSLHDLQPLFTVCVLCKYKNK